MRKLEPANYRVMPWKNGGGTTTEVFMLPPDATMETFEARVSIARVESDGPFSHFAGIDRTLVVTQGGGITLETADGSRLALEVGSAPFSFTGDDPVHASLTAGPITDLNVMTRRSLLRHQVTRVVFGGDETRTWVCSGELAMLMLLEGQVSARSRKDSILLEAGDVLVLTGTDGQVQLEPSGASSVSGPGALVVDVFRR